ncbi:MAG: sialate O-acetylesterase [Planctomycetaceae bacterium]|nr:sialate O-acetylesterase [Planctomycetaceae bacterium]
MKCCSRFSLLALLLMAPAVVRADVKLPTVLDSHMVIQRDQPVRIWGWADAGEEVSVTLGDETQKATAAADGSWLVELKAQKADGQARQIKVKGKNELVLDDVLVGEVWIGSGQSNMEWQLTNTHGAPEAIAAANFPQIRLYHVPKVQEKSPAKDINAKWKVCTPENVPAFSAVLYYFGKELHEELKVPVGLINSSWGGSPIEPWTIKGESSGGMYNGMIAPLTNVAVRGAIWYQGETNVIQKNGLAYADKMADLINGWRTAFRNPELAFYFVQIAPWEGRYEPGQLPALWEAQVASLKIPHTGMAVTTDLVDNIKDIHPRNKLDVGHRLCLWALSKIYGHKDLVYSGPLYESMTVEGNSIRLKFAHTAEGLKTSDGNAPTDFQIAAAEGEFVPATAKIDGHTIVVSAESISAPARVQFGWHALAQPNLFNSAGLPASPFQTTDWQGGTGTK